MSFAPLHAADAEHAEGRFDGLDARHHLIAKHFERIQVRHHAPLRGFSFGDAAVLGLTLLALACLVASAVAG
jgi:hypothetical protein